MKQYRNNAYDKVPSKGQSQRISDSKLDFRPGITPDDPEWGKWRTTFRTELLESSVQDVVSKHFTSAQQSYIMPPPKRDDTFRIQSEGGEAYRTFFKPGRRFENVPKNLATKLTMLHFGLPVANITFNNIFNCGKEGDVTDEDDEPEGTPRVQIIIYSEKPIEFLEKHNEELWLSYSPQ